MRDFLSLLLPKDRLQRFRLVQAWLAGALVVFTAGVLHLGAALGYVDVAMLRWWTATAGLGTLILLGVMHSGLNHRLRDPSLTLPTMVFGVVCAAWAYSFTGSAHALTCLLLAVVMMFAPFGLSVRQTLGLGALTLALFAAVMAVMTRRDPVHYPAGLEQFTFAALCFMVGGLTLLSVRLQMLRDRMRQQKVELQAALAHIQRLATHDELTGLVNRRRMQELLEGERMRCSRTNAPWCLALIDLDNFKRINDEHGHAIGDAVLRAMSQHAQALIRKTDVLARWGGEEFVLLLPDTALPPAAHTLDRLRAHFHAAPLHVHGVELSISFSAGITQYQKGEPVAQALDRADRLCYQAKTRGRNRVEGLPA